MKRYWFGILTFAFLCFSFAWAGAPAEFKGHEGLVFNVAFSNDGKILATASFDGTVKLWDAKEAKELKSCAGHKESVYSVSFNKDGSQFASCGNDGLVKVYDVKSLNEVKTMMVDLPKPVIKKEEPKKEEPKDKDKKD